MLMSARQMQSRVWTEMYNNTFNMIIAGVGGQGGLTASRVLADAAVMAGHYAVIGETFGASRRGGTVLTHIRLSDHEVGPLVPAGELDLLIGLEPLEALRAAIYYSGPRTAAFVSTRAVQTVETMIGRVIYPSMTEIIRSLRSVCSSVFSIDPTRFLTPSQLGMLNAFMIGVLCQKGAIPIEPALIEESMSHMTSLRDEDLSAFRQGMNAQLVPA